MARYFDALVRNDYETANSCLAGGDQNVFAMARPNGTEMDAIYARLLQKLQYDIQSPASTTAMIEGSAAKVQEDDMQQVSVTITSMNVPRMFDTAMSELSEAYAKSLVNCAPMPPKTLEAELYLNLARSMSSDTAPLLTGTLQIRVVQSGGVWRIDADSTLYNAVTGNFFQIVNQVQQWKQQG